MQAAVQLQRVMRGWVSRQRVRASCRADIDLAAAPENFGQLRRLLGALPCSPILGSVAD